MEAQGFSERAIVASRKLRDQVLKPVNKVLSTTKISPHFLTALTAICGISAAMLMFSNYFIFCILVAAHLLFDGLDGSLARYTDSTSKRGEQLDYLVDRISCLAFLFAIAVRLNDFYVYITIVLYLLSLAVHKMQTQKTAYYYSRTLVVIILCFLPLGTWVATVAYLSAGCLSLFSLSIAFQDALSRAHRL